MYDLAVLNAKIVTPTEAFMGGICIRDGIIDCICGKGAVRPAHKTIDAKGMFLMPGVVDVHFHCHDPARNESEDFCTGTMAAAAGGVTTVFEMPTANPSAYNSSILEARRKIAERKAYVDFALYGACGTINREDIIGLANSGAIGYKVFLQMPKGREDEFYGVAITNMKDLYDALSFVRETGLITSFHAEDEETLNLIREKLMKENRKDPLAHCDARPDFAEALSTAKLVVLAGALSMKFHFAHVSCAKAIEYIRHGQMHGADLSAETTPDYLIFTRERMKEVGPYAKICPPLRPKKDVVALWNGVKEGTISIIASDHSPYTKDEKEVGWENIWLAGAGTPTVELLAPIVLSEALKGKISLEQAVCLLSRNPAKRFGVYPKKGAIIVGADADFFLYNAKTESIVNHEKMFTRGKDSAKIYDNLRIKGSIVRTFVRGKEIFSDGEIVGKPGHGTFIKPTIHSSSHTISPRDVRSKET
jgi:allantoinase